MKLKIPLIVATVLISSALLFAQTGGGKSVRVRFSKGKSSATYTGTISHSSDAFILSARRGQTVTVNISGSGEPALHYGTVKKGSKNTADYKSINDNDLKSFTYEVSTNDDIAVLVGTIRGSSHYRLTITIK